MIYNDSCITRYAIMPFYNHLDCHFVNHSWFQLFIAVIDWKCVSSSTWWSLSSEPSSPLNILPAHHHIDNLLFRHASSCNKMKNQVFSEPKRDKRLCGWGAHSLVRCLVCLPERLNGILSIWRWTNLICSRFSNGIEETRFFSHSHAPLIGIVMKKWSRFTRI